jgi:hypothetical protein
MFHGIKKKEKKELTEEEIKVLDDKINKLKELQVMLLDMRGKRDYSEDVLNKLLTAAKLMADCSTIWTYRKEIFLHLKAVKSDEEFVKLLSDDIKNIQKLQMANPKSYVLWYHR